MGQKRGNLVAHDNRIYVLIWTYKLKNAIFQARFMFIHLLGSTQFAGTS